MESLGVADRMTICNMAVEMGRKPPICSRTQRPLVGDNIDTDMICPGRYLELTDPKGIGSHCLGGLDEKIAANFPKDGFVVVCCSGKKFRLRFQPRARRYRAEGDGRFNGYCEKFCAYFLPERDQFEAAADCVRSGCR